MSILGNHLASRGRGFTLVELLVVIAIIGVLVALLLPAVQSARGAARRMQCSNNLKQLGLAIQNYHVPHGVFPISIAYNKAGPNPAAEVNGKGWITSILPYLEQQNLYDQFVPCFQGDIGAGGGLKHLDCRDAMKQQLAALQCPSDASVRELATDQFQWTGIPVALTSYKGNIGDTQMGNDSSIHTGTKPDCHNTVGCNGIFYRNNYQEPVSIDDVRDGTTNTFLIGEDIPAYNNHSTAYYCNGDYSSCHAPLNFLPNLEEPVSPAWPDQWWNVMSFRSRHPGGGLFCLGDGSVHFISETIDHDLYRALSTKAGGEVVTLP